MPVSPHQPLIAPSLLAANFSRVGDEVSHVIQAGADWLHLDVMDGHFVDNISFGSALIAAIHASNDIFLDVHLMISRPDHYMPRFVEAGADLISVHVEADHAVSETLSRIRQAGIQAGLVLNPATPASAVEPFLEQIDLLLVMTVVPGFGGQAFMEEMLPKIEQIAQWRSQKELPFRLQVDGGINALTATACAQAGADTFVAGSSIFQAANAQEAIDQLRASSQGSKPLGR